MATKKPAPKPMKPQPSKEQIMKYRSDVMKATKKDLDKVSKKK